MQATALKYRGATQLTENKAEAAKPKLTTAPFSQERSVTRRPPGAVLRQAPSCRGVPGDGQGVVGEGGGGRVAWERHGVALEAEPGRPPPDLAMSMAGQRGPALEL